MSSAPSKQGYTILRDLDAPLDEGEKNMNYPGGIVLPFIGGAALNLGDVVFMSADETVNKSVTTADHAASIGVVVGGDLTGGECGGSIAQYGVRAVNDAGANKGVLVQVFGCQYVVCDAAIAVGPICASTTVAGRVRAAVQPVIAAGAVAVTSSAANGAIITGDGTGKVIGKLLHSSAAAGDVRMALIT